MMKYIILLTIFVSISLQAQTLNIKPLSKSPKSLFLVKKAKIDNDMGEPIIYPSEKHSKLLKNEKIFNKYRLQVLEND